MGLDIKDWIQISSIVILASVAFIAPYVIERWRHAYRSPKLKISFRLSSPYCHKTQMIGENFSFPAFYFRFMVENVGLTQAEDCEVFLEHIYRENSAGEMVPIKNFSPTNLKWSGLRDPFKRTFQPGRKIFCDIGRIHHPDHGYKSLYKDISEKDQKKSKFIFEFPEIYYTQWDSLVPGKYKISVSIYSKNAEKVTRDFYISWSGEWRDVEQDIFNELVIT